MLNLYQAVTEAHGGRGLESLAAANELTREQADAAVKALLPALSTALMTKAAQPGGLGDIAGAMLDDEHRQAFADAAVAQQPASTAKGAAFLQTIFGSEAIVAQVAQQAARFTGIPETTLQSMLPTVASLIVGGLAQTLHVQGMSGMLAPLAQGGLGSILERFGGAAGNMAASGFPGMVGTLVNSFFGGVPPAAPTPAAPTATASTATPPAGAAPFENLGRETSPASDPAAVLPPLVQAGMDALFKMFTPGVATAAPQPPDLGRKIDDTLKGSR